MSTLARFFKVSRKDSIDIFKAKNIDEMFEFYVDLFQCAGIVCQRKLLL
jgi:hypothetical protein